VFYLLVTMATMLGGWIIYLLSPNANGIIDAVGINMLIMTVGVIVILRYWERSSLEPASVLAITEGSETSTQIQVSSGETSDAVDLEHATVLANSYVLYFLVMMASMTALGFVYVIVNGALGLELGLIVSVAIMTTGTIPILRRSASSS